MISYIFRVSKHQIVGKENSTEFGFYALISEFKFRTNPGLSQPTFEQPDPGFLSLFSVDRLHVWSPKGKVDMFYPMLGILNSGIQEIFARGIRNPGLWNPKYSARNPSSTDKES